MDRDSQFVSISVRSFKVAIALIVCVAVPAPAYAACDGLDARTTATPDSLFDSARSCDSMIDAVFLMMIGQIRALTDLSVFPPKSETDENQAANIYSLLYYEMGGSGPDELYRNSSSYHELTRRIKDWRPTDLLNYEPGWAYSSTPSYPQYFGEIERYKNHRLDQLSNYYSLVSDDEYFEMKVQADELLARNDNMLTAGTADAEKYSELSKAMSQISERIRKEGSQ